MAFAKPKMRFAQLHLPRLTVGVAGLLLLFAAFVSAPAAHAAVGINQQINFQGRLLNTSDVPMNDGNYNAEFKIYKNGDGLSAGDATPAGSPGTLLWTEDHLNANSQGVQLINGYFSIQLGSITSLSSVDFNQDTLWISINFGNTNATCTPFSTCAGDGEMIPMKRLSAQAYAFNSLQLGGLTASQFGQLAANQTFTGTNLFKATNANELQVQNASGNSVLNVDTSGGAVTFGQASALNGQIVFANSSNANTVTIQTGTTAGSYTLTLPTNAATNNYCLKAGTVSGSNVPLTWGNCVGGTFLNKNAADTSSAAVAGTLYGFTNTDTGASGVLSLSNAGTGSALSVTDSGNPSAGNAVIVANNTNATPSGNLLDLQAGGASKLAVDTSGNLTGGTINGQTISASASFTGTVNAVTGYKVNGAAATGNYLRGNGTNFVSSTIQASDLPDLGSSYIKNTVTVQTGANLYVRSAAVGSVGAVIEGASGQTADLLDLNTYNGTTSTTVAKIDNGGNLTAASLSTAGTAVVGSAISNTKLSVVEGTGLGGIAIKAAATTPGDLLQMFDPNGVSLSKFNSAGQLTLGTVAASGTVYQGQLTFADGTADNFGVTLKTNGAITASRTIFLPDEAGTVCLRNSANCGFVSGSGGANFINNGVSVQNAANFYIRSNGDSVTGVLEGSSGQTSDLLRLNTYNGTTSTTVVKFTSNGSLAITNGSATAIQVKNASNQNVVTADASAGQVVLGQSSALNGTLLFKNSSNTNGITINSTAATSNYTLTLPSAAPAAGLCLETSTGSATQLVFASCANNNTSISEVQEWDANNTNTVSVSPGAVGDEMVLTTQIPTSGVTVTGISGGGVSAWNKVIVSAGNGTVNRVEMWVGTITAVGSSTITVTYSSSPGAEEITATEFTAAGVNASTSWGVESSNSQLNSGSSSTVTFPSATAVNGSELYVGYGQVQNPPATAGSSTGFNYIITSNQHNVLTYNTALAANTSYQPTANQNSAGQSNTVSAVLTAFVTSTSINNTTSLQKANFYVQAASGGTVAGVLQAASTGTADILNLRNASATNVVTVGSTGAAVFKNSTDSATAFQVQNTAGNSVFGVNTSANAAFLGKSGVLGGSLTFNDASDTNTITLAAPTSVASSYTLSLPSNTPTAGLCLATSPSNATQLIFSSCATQVSAASISYVNRWGNSGTSVTTIADAPGSVGNLIVFYSHATNNVSITGISGGGVTNWTKITSNANTTGQGNNEMWRGVVTAAGSGTITATYSAAAGVNDIEAQEFTMGSSSGTWAVDTSGTAISSSSVTTINYPTLTPLNSSELYAGYAWGANTMSAGTTTGFTYQSTSGGKFLAFNTNVTGGTSYTPTATQSTAGAYNSIAAVIAAYAGTSVIVNSTATQQANFNVQSAQSGSVAGVLQAATSGTADIFQTKNAAGNNITSVNSATGLTLGTPGAVGGQLTFASSANTNTISILAPSAPGSSYQLTLPTTTPAAGQCLATSPANANQLVFSSCANQVTSVAISYVNGWTGTSANNTMTLNDSPANLGDLIILFVAPQKSNTVTSVSGGGVSAWSKITSTTSGTGMEMWRGQVTSTGASTISVSLSGAAGNNDIAAYEFTTGSTTGSWVVDTSNTQSNASSTTVTYPNLTPQSTKDLYIGYARAANTMSAGSNAGFNYSAGGFTTDMAAYNTAVSSGVQPTATQSAAGVSVTAGALIAAYSSSSVISNSTVTQQANFNVQAATPGSVAGTLQAYFTGTSDVMDILDGNGTLTDSFGSTGNFLVKPSTNSASAVQVQTSGGVNVLSVDTNGKTVSVGAGATGENSPSLLVLDNETGTSADPTELNGAMYYNATTHSFRCGVDGAWQNCTGLIYSNTSNSSAVNNCTNNCAAFSTAAAIPANYCQAGRLIRLLASGYFSSQATPSNLQFGVYYGTDSSTASNDTLLGVMSPAATVTSASNNYFQLNFNAICFSTSTMQANGVLSIQTGTSTAGMTSLPMGSTTGTTVVSSSAKNLYLFPIWDSANTANTATLTQFAVNAF